MHGILEWLPFALLAMAGLPLDRRVPGQKGRCVFYALFLLSAIILDLNRVTFRADALNGAFLSLVLVAISELFWICVRKDSRLLLSGALVMLVPVFVYVYFALLMILPLPCHKGSRAEFLSSYECAAGTYVLERRLSFDIFKPARVYTLSRDLRRTPLRKQTDKFQAPQGYMEAYFEPLWQCVDGKARGGVKVDLFIDGYTLWSLKEEPKSE